MPERVFGEILGILVGAEFANRRQAYSARVHRQTQAGISGTSREGADSIVISGGYEDDKDFGDLILYTGHGGQDGRGRQVADQSIADPGNAALVRTQIEGLPLRVLRGPVRDSRYAPAAGYRYDGLYRVVDHEWMTGKAGFQIVQFRLERIDIRIPLPEIPLIKVVDEGPVERRAAVISRLLRDRRHVDKIKDWYDFACQICGERLLLEGAIPYAEAAHIRALGYPHDGQDDPTNMLCLCPNDHKRFDNGALTLLDDLQVIDGRGKRVGLLRTVQKHRIDLKNVAYHRSQFRDLPAHLR